MRILTFALFFLSFVIVETTAILAAEAVAYPTFKFKGFLQYDSAITGFTEKDFGIRRVRTDFRVAVSPQVEYRLNADYGAGSASLLDAYANIKIGDTQWIQVGKTKSPIGFELLQTPTNLLLPEFGFSTYLVPNRDTGVQWISRTKDLELNLGVFAGAPDFASVDTESDRSRSVAGRAFFWPIRGEVQSLGLGVGGNIESKFGTASASNLGTYTYRGYGKLFAYSSGVYANGTGYRIVPQGYFIQGPVSVFGEYALSSQEISNGAKQNQTVNTAWQGVLEYVVTGETATYGELVPSKPFGVDSGLGALQLGFRIGELNFDDSAFTTYATTSQATKVQQLGASANWIWNKSVQWTLGLDQVTRFNANGSESSDLVALVRSQITF